MNNIFKEKKEIGCYFGNLNIPVLVRHLNHFYCFINFPYKENTENYLFKKDNVILVTPILGILIILNYEKHF